MMDNDIIEIAKIMAARENVLPSMFAHMTDIEKEPFLIMAKQLNPENFKDLIFHSNNGVPIGNWAAINKWNDCCKTILSERATVLGTKIPENSYEFLYECWTVRTKIIAIKAKLYPICTAPRNGSSFYVLGHNGIICKMNFNGYQFVQSNGVDQGRPDNLYSKVYKNLYGWMPL